jgi:hypothetical protein
VAPSGSTDTALATGLCIVAAALGLTMGGCRARAARRARAIDSAIYAYANHGAYQEQHGAYADAAETYATAIDIRGGQDDLASSQPRRRAQNSLAWLLATCPEDTVRDGPRAVVLAEQIVAAVPRDAVYLNTLAAAYAEVGRFEDAAATQEEAIGNLPPGHHLYEAYVERLRTYQDARGGNRRRGMPTRPWPRKSPRRFRPGQATVGGRTLPPSPTGRKRYSLLAGRRLEPGAVGAAHVVGPVGGLPARARLRVLQLDGHGRVDG